MPVFRNLRSVTFSIFTINIAGVSVMGARCGKLWSGGGLQAGSVLDRVISQASSEDQTVLYKLADYKKGMLKNHICLHILQI